MSVNMFLVSGNKKPNKTYLTRWRFIFMQLCGNGRLPSDKKVVPVPISGLPM